MGKTNETKKRRTWVLLARLVVSLVLLGVLIFKVASVDLSQAIPPWRPANGLWLAGATALTFIAIGISAVRWHQVLIALGVHSRWQHLFSHCLAGQFISNVLPTTIGGDVIRVSRLSRENGRDSTSFASVVLERLSGWIVLPLTTFAGLAMNPGMRHLGNATWLAFGVALATLVGLVIITLIVADQRILGRFTESAGWQRFLGAIHLGIDELRRKPGAALSVLAAGLGYQLVLISAALMAASALHINEVGPTALLTFMPAVLIIQVLPIGISGLGLREAAFVLFLTPLGVAPERAIALGLLLYLLNLVTSLPGAGSFAFGHRKRASTMSGAA